MIRWITVFLVLFSIGCTANTAKPVIEQPLIEPTDLSWRKLGDCKYVGIVQFKGTDQVLVFPVPKGICKNSI